MRRRQLARLIYLQVVFLGLTYVVGVWQTIATHGATLTSPDVIEHGVAASGFAVLTGLVGLVAGIQGMKKVAISNIALFSIAVVGGATGFSFLGDPTSLAGMNITNMSMMAVVGIGMPISGFSLFSVSKSVDGAGIMEDRTVRRTTYLALGAIAVTITTGTAMISTPLYRAILTIHLSFAALAALSIFGVLVTTVRRGLTKGPDTSAIRRLDYSLIALVCISVAGGTGVMDLLIGGIPYALGMAEFAVLSYGFLILVMRTPSPIPTVSALDIKAGFDPGRRTFIRLATAASIILSTIGLAGLLRSITLAPPPVNQPVLTFPRFKVANLSDVQVDTPITFYYPLDNEPNMLVKLGTKAAGGVGPGGDIIAFSQVCQHLGCIYGYQANGTNPPCDPGYTAAGPVGYCCCHGTIYDMSNGAKVLGGPSPRPAPQVILEVDSSGDIYATGMTPPTIFGHNTGSNDVTNDLYGGNLVG